MHSLDLVTLLAWVIALAGLVTGPVERRLFRENLSTRSKLLAYAGAMLLLGALTLTAIRLRGWTALTTSPADVASWLPAPGVSAVAIGAVLAAYFGLGLWPLLQSLRGPGWRRAYATAIRKHGVAFPGMLPNTALECAVFALLSLTAGVCEEILFRGFMIGYLVGSPLKLEMVTALAISCVIFGLNHAYQGAKGVISTAIAGLGFGLVFLLSDQLLPGVLLHALVNLQVAFVLRPMKGPQIAMSARPDTPPEQAPSLGHFRD